MKSLLRRGPKPVMQQIIERDRRWETIVFAIEYINYEAVPGDILEFGVFGGVSLAMLAEAMRYDPKGMERRVVGFDSFRGLPKASEDHARWKEADCAINHGWHPLIPENAPITAQVSRDLFQACNLGDAILETGLFADTLRACVPSKYQKAALVHIDCDLYESTREVLDGIEPILQSGALLLFDDWFHYKGDPRRGEARAFHEFLASHPAWGSQPYRQYGVFGKAFVLYRK